MASKVTILEKTDSVWSPGEVQTLVQKGMVEVEQLPRMPHRLAAMNKPLRGGSFQEILPHSDFTEREVDYRDRWK